MRSLPFDKPGKWFRGNLHTHTTQSDGLKTPSQVCGVYKRRGYDFVALTDHFLEQYKWTVTDSTPCRCDGFTTILGAELHAPKTSLGGLWHILAVGLPADFAPAGKNETGPQIADRASRAGAYVAVAHPAWYDLTDQDVLSIKSSRAIEIFNMTCLLHNGKGDSTGYVDRLLSQGHRYHIIATDDAHFSPQRRDWCCFSVMVRSRFLDPRALVDALHAGHFYTSQGPRITDVKYNPRRRRLVVHTSPARTCRISSRGYSTAYVNSSTDRSRFDLDMKLFKEPYARLTIADRRGHQAWSNPFWF